MTVQGQTAVLKYNLKLIDGEIKYTKLSFQTDKVKKIDPASIK
jgi:hypothetical protein